MASLPIISADESIKEICESVSFGNISVSEGIQYIHDRLAPILEDHNDTNKITVLAVLLVEKLIPTSQGVFLSLEDLDHMWNNAEPNIDLNPKLQMSFLVLSCMQLTTTGPVRNGAKSMGKSIDQMMPEAPGQAEGEGLN